MNGRDFYDKVMASDKLEWLGVQEGCAEDIDSDEVFVCDRSSGVKHALSLLSLLTHAWKELEEVVTGKRDPRVMMQISRIVGYYSRVQNWNGSKRAELRDRHRGQYSLEEAGGSRVTGQTRTQEGCTRETRVGGAEHLIGV